MTERAGKIFDYLRQEGYISGEELATLLGVSRTAVWKQIESLRELGYEIEASPRKGYLLRKKPDRLYPWEVGKGLKTRFIGKEIEYYDRISSTNERAKELFPSRPPEGALVLAEEQTGGKGRLGRKWYAPPGGIWMTILLTPRLPTAELPKLTMVGAVALSKAIRQELGLETLIKWPNDLLLEGKKISGILTELTGELGRVEYLVLGVGINANQRQGDFPEELGTKAGSLRMAMGEKIDRLALLRTYLQIFEAEYLQALEEGFSSILRYCREYSATLGRWVEIRDGDRVYHGKAIEIEESGGLVIQTEKGERIRVLSGDATLSREPS